MTNHFLIFFLFFSVLLCQQFSGFEIDGDQIDSPSVPAPDWASANNNGAGVLDGWVRGPDGTCYDSDTSKGQANAFLFCDKVRSNDDIFTPATKHDSPPSTWTYLTGSTPKKSDISTAMLYTVVVNGITWLVIGTTRIPVNGDVYYEIEINKYTTNVNGKQTPYRQAGDLLISLDLPPSTDNVVYYFYRCTTTSAICYDYGNPTIVSTTTRTAYVNSSNIEIYSGSNVISSLFTFGPWQDYDSDFILKSSFSPDYHFFFEFAINMDKLLLTANNNNAAPCFNYFMLRSKTSKGSSSSNLEDLLGPFSVPFCGGIAIVKFYDLNVNGKLDSGEPLSTPNSVIPGFWCFRICKNDGSNCIEVCTDSIDQVTPLQPGQYLVTELFNKGVPTLASYNYIRWYITTAGFNGNKATQNVTVRLLKGEDVAFGNICFENVTFTVRASADAFGPYPPKIYWKIESNVVPEQEIDGTLPLTYSGNGVWSVTTKANFLPYNNISYVLKIPTPTGDYVTGMTRYSRIIYSTIANTTMRCAATYIDVPFECASLYITKFIDTNGDGVNNANPLGNGWKFFALSSTTSFAGTTNTNGLANLCLTPGSYNIVENSSSVPPEVSSLLWVETTIDRKNPVNSSYPAGSVEIGNICLESIKFSVYISPYVLGTFSSETFKAYWNISSPSAAQVKCRCLTDCACPTSGVVNLTYYDSSTRTWSGYTGNKILPGQDISYYFSIQSGGTMYYFGGSNSVGTNIGGVTLYHYTTTSSYPNCNLSFTSPVDVPAYNVRANLTKVLNPGEDVKIFDNLDKPAIDFNINGPFDINLNGTSGPSSYVIWPGNTDPLLLPIGSYVITEYPKNDYVTLTPTVIPFFLNFSRTIPFEVACLRDITWYLKDIKTQNSLILEYSILATNILPVSYSSRGKTYFKNIPACSGCTWNYTHHLAIMYNDTLLFTIYEVIGGVKVPLPNADNVRLQADASCKDLVSLIPYPLTTIYGKKYVDCNADGYFNGNDYPAGNFSFKLLYPNGTVVASTTSDANGNFQFNTVFPGQYKVREMVDPDYTLVSPNDVILNVPIATPQNVTFYNSPKVILDFEARSKVVGASVNITAVCVGTDGGAPYERTFVIDSVYQLLDLYVGNFTCNFTVKRSC